MKIGTHLKSYKYIFKTFNNRFIISFHNKTNKNIIQVNKNNVYKILYNGKKINY